MNSKGMDNEDLIPITLFCTTYRVDVTVIDSLEESGLIEITLREHQRFVAQAEVSRLEKILRLHEDLGINAEGIEAIEHLLARMEHLQEELQHMRNRLQRFGEADQDISPDIVPT